MKYDCIVVGAGISGLTAGALLAKRGLSVAVVEHAAKPGGTCGVFKRLVDGNEVIFDQGTSMFFGFGEMGFNSHRFIFNSLEEDFNLIRHEYLYAINYNGNRILFPANIKEFVDNLSDVFPSQKSNIRRFYREMSTMYQHVIAEVPNYTTPDETDGRSAIKSMLKHPLSYLKFLSYMNINAETLLRKYFRDPRIIYFFDKLTSTYCYSTVDEAPAILASVMFIDNHVGGSWYPAGSSMFLPGVLEKVIEENNGDIYYDSTVTEILFNEETDAEHVCGCKLANDKILNCDHIIYSGPIWNLYEKLIPRQFVTITEYHHIVCMEPTYSSLVFYSLVEKSVISEGTLPIEMLAGPAGVVDDSEITVYIPSIDHEGLCPEEFHIVMVVGPMFNKKPLPYDELKDQETDRIINLLNKRFPGFANGIIYKELATPTTIERFTMKPGGAPAGPKQKMGQHMFTRQHITTKWRGLYCCGEGCTMGTGTPAVTTSAIAAANCILKKLSMEPYIHHPNMNNHINVLKAPVKKDWISDIFPPREAEIMLSASHCLYCLSPQCCFKEQLDIPGIMRRATCGNFAGAIRQIKNSSELITEEFLIECENNCVRFADGNPLKIKDIISAILLL